MWKSILLFLVETENIFDCQYKQENRKFLKDLKRKQRVSLQSFSFFFGSTEGRGRGGEGFLRRGNEVKHNLLC
jgi:hypothetical protein